MVYSFDYDEFFKTRQTGGVVKFRKNKTDMLNNIIVISNTLNISLTELKRIPYPVLFEYSQKATEIIQYRKTKGNG